MTEELKKLIGEVPEEIVEKLDHFLVNSSLDKRQKNQLIDIILELNSLYL